MSELRYEKLADDVAGMIAGGILRAGERLPSVRQLAQERRVSISTAVLLVPNASNPLGSVMPDASKKKLAQLMAARKIPVIEDDIYGDLCYAAQRPWPVKSFDKAGNVMLCASFSKCLSPALRCGFVAAGRYRAAVALQKMLASGGINPITQRVLAERLLPASFFFPPATMPGGDILLAVIILGVVCSGVAYLLYFRLIAEIGAAPALTVTFLIPLFGVLWGWLFLAETVGWHTLAGGFIVILGTALVTGFSPRLLFARKSAVTG